MCLWIVVTLGLTGCAPIGLEAVRPEPRSLGQDVPLYQPPLHPFKAPPVPAPPEAPTEVLTLRQALALALLQNPELSAFAWEVRAAEAPPEQRLHFRRGQPVVHARLD